VAARFSVPFQTGCGSPPASYTAGIESFPGVKRPGRGVDHPPPSSSKVEERVDLIHILSLWIFLASSRVNCIFTFISTNKSTQGYPQRIKTNLLHNTPVYWQLDLQHVSAQFIGHLQAVISSDVAT
jgi:hypothetical protein